MKRFAMFTAALGLVVVLAGPGWSVAVTLTDGNSTINFDFGEVGSDPVNGPLGLVDWTVDGVQHGGDAGLGFGLSQWFWWSPGGFSAESFLGRHGGAVVAGPVGNKVSVTYPSLAFFRPDFDAIIEYELIGGAPASGESTLKEKITLVNQTENFGSIPKNMTWTIYNDLLIDQVGNVVTAAPGGLLFTSLGLTSFAEVEVVSAPAAISYNWQIATWPDLLVPAGNAVVSVLSLNDAVKSNFSNNLAGLGFDDTFAMKWEVIIPAASSVVFEIEKRIRPLTAPPIPEPSTWALFALGALGVIGWRRRSRSA